MLESVTVRNISNGASMIFSYHEEINGIIVKDTSGLHPSEVTINYEGSSEGHRSENVLAPAARNIKLLFHINKYANVDSLRQQLYGLFFSGSSVELVFTKNDMPYTIYGTVESCEANIFSDNTDVLASVLCNNPNFIIDSTTLPFTSAGVCTYNNIYQSDVSYRLTVTNISADTSYLTSITFTNSLDTQVLTGVINTASSVAAKKTVVLDNRQGSKSFMFEGGNNLLGIFKKNTGSIDVFVPLRPGINTIKLGANNLSYYTGSLTVYPTKAYL